MTEQVKKESQIESISSEQAFDMLPYVVDIYDKIDLNKFRKDITKQYQKQKAIDKKPINPIDVAIDTTKYILKNSPKLKKEFFEIVAIAEKRPVKEVKEQSFLKTISAIKRIFSDPELVDFFRQVTN